MPQSTKTPVMVLQELTIKRGLPNPDYQIIFSISGTHENRFDFSVSVAGIEATGTGSSKQIGKHRAARNALLKLEQLGLYNPKEDPIADIKAPLMDDNSSFRSAPGYIVTLLNKCIENKLPQPQYIEISDVGPPHAKEFTYECRISSIVTEAKATTKKIAKQMAAFEMLKRIQDIIPDIEAHSDDSESSGTNKDGKILSEMVIPNKMATMSDIPITIKKIMEAKDVSYDDVADDLKKANLESFKKMMEKLEIDYDLKVLQEEEPCIVELTLKIETVFTMLGMGENIDKAEENALKQTFMILEKFIRLT